MKVFVTGATGYIGGAVAAGLRDAGHQVVGLVRSEEKAAKLQAQGIAPVLGSLEDAEVLSARARDAEVVVNAAHADHAGAVETLLAGLAGSGKTFIQTSGSSVVSDDAEGRASERVYDEDTPYEPMPGRAARVALNERIRDTAAEGLRSIVIAPTMIYGSGRGLNPHSIQVPWLVALAKKHGRAKHIGPGENRWANVQIDDLVDLYLLALERAPAGAFYYAENGEASMREICAAINEALGTPQPPEAMTVEEAAAEWGEGAARHTMASNSRVRARRARAELGWAPHRRSLAEEIAAVTR